MVGGSLLMSRRASAPSGRLLLTMVMVIAALSVATTATTVAFAQNVTDSTITDLTEQDALNALNGATEIEIVEISGRTYALVAALDDSAVQVMDITDPASPVRVAGIFDGQDGFEALGGAADIETVVVADRTYAVVAGAADDAVQIIDITDPASPIPTAGIFDGQDGFGALDVPRSVAIVEISGSTYVLVAAHSDDAIQVIDITDPERPLPASSVSDGRNGFEALDGPLDIEIVEISGSTYAVVASWGEDAVQVMDITDPTNPVPTAGIFDGQEGFDSLGRAAEVEITAAFGRTYAMVTAHSDDAVQVIDVTDPASPLPVGSITGDDFALDGPRGMEVVQISGRTYAVVSSNLNDAVRIVDVTNPAAPAMVAGVSHGQDGFEALDGPLDVEIVEISGHTYAVVASFEIDAVQVMDITDPASPVPVSSVRDHKGGYLIDESNETEVLEASGRTYVLVTSFENDSVQIIDITYPHLPLPVANIVDGRDGFEALGGAADIELYTAAGRTYALVSGWLDDAIQVIDVTDPEEPLPVGVVDGQAGDFALNGATDIEVDRISGRTYAVVASYYHDAVQVIDVTEPASPTFASAVFDNQDGFEALDGARNIELATISGRTYALVSALNEDAVQVMEITDPASPVPTAVMVDGQDGFDALGGPRDSVIFGASGRTYAIVTAVVDGAIQVVDITRPLAPVAVTSAFDGQGGLALGSARDISLYETPDHTYALVASWGDDAIQVIDVTNPALPIPVSSITDDQDGFEYLDKARSVEVVLIEGRAYAIATGFGDDAIQIADVTDPASPLPVAGVADDRNVFALDGSDDIAVATISGNHYTLVASSWDNSLQIINITDPTLPIPVSTLLDGRNGFDALDNSDAVEVVEISGRTYALVASWGDSAIQVADITDPANPLPVSSVFDSQPGFSLGDAVDVRAATIDGRTYAIAASWLNDAIQIIDVTDPASPARVTSVTDGRAGFDNLDGVQAVEVVEISGRTYILVANWIDANTIQIIEITTPISPVHVATITDEQDGFDALAGANRIDTVTISGSTYALVASWRDSAIQVINITDPASPVPVAGIFDNQDGFDALGAAYDVKATTIDGTTYALVTSYREDAIQVINITDPASPVPVSSAAYGEEGFSGLHGALDVEVITISDRIYAVVIGISVMQIIDITDPASPVPVVSVMEQ